MVTTGGILSIVIRNRRKTAGQRGAKSIPTGTCSGDIHAAETESGPDPRAGSVSLWLRSEVMSDQTVTSRRTVCRPRARAGTASALGPRGEFVAVDARLAATSLLANDEAVQHWNRGQRSLAPGYTAAEIGSFLADLALRGLLARPARLEAVRRAALAHGD